MEDNSDELSLCCTLEEDGACSYSQKPPDPMAQALLQLWKHSKLCDVQLVSSDGAALAAHRLVLAAASGFFRAMFTGAGTAMREAQVDPSPNDEAHEQQLQQRVRLHFNATQLNALLEAVYVRRVHVASDSVGWLMEMAGYLECPLLMAACCQYLRSALAPPSCVDVLLVAHQYHCARLRRDALSFLCARLPSLLQSEWRGSLARLPRELLVELLSSEELVVESELDVLSAVAEWVAPDPGRSAHLQELLGLVQLAALPPEPASGPCLAALSTSPGGRSVVAAVQELIGGARAPGTYLPQQQQQQQQQQQRDRDAVWGKPAAQQLGWSLEEHTQKDERVAAAEVSTPGPSHAQSTGATEAAGLQTGTASAATTAAAGSAAVASGMHAPELDGAVPPTTHLGSSWEDGACCGSGDGGGPLAADAAAAAAAGAACGARVGVRRSGIHLENGTWPSARRRAYRPSKLLVAGGHDPSWRSLRDVEVLDPLEPDPAWGPTAALLPGHAMPFAASALLGRDLYLVGGAMFSSVVARYEGGGGGGGQWAACPALGTPRVHAAVAAAAGRLFVCGGRSQVNQVLATVESYSPGADHWEAAPHPMGEARYACAAASLGGTVYVIGGQSGRSAMFDTLEAMDPDSGRWLPVSARMLSERKYCGAAPLNGCIYVCGGLRNAGRQRLASVEAFDPREGVFREIAPMRHARSSCGAAALGDRLYVAGGGADGGSFHDSVEVLEPAMGRWRQAAPLGCARSGLALAAI